MWNLAVFAVLGLLTGAAARNLYPGRQSLHILGTMLLGMAGAAGGGMTSYSLWPAVDGELHANNLIFSFVGAAVAIACWAGVAYQRSLSGLRTRS